MTDIQPWYTEWFNSPYYHQLYFERNQADATKFIDNLVSWLKPAPESLILDIACGKGRHSIELASEGFDVTGIDLAPDSILEAKQHEKDNLHFFVHDMRLPFWINYFDYAFNFFTSFGYFDTQREHNNAIRTVAQSLKENGIFVIDYLNVFYAEEHLIPTSEVKDKGVTYQLSRWTDEHHFYKKIVVQDEALSNPLEFQEKVAKFSLDDFTEMLSYQQMQVQQVFGDYDFSNYHAEKSPRMIIVAKKLPANFK